MRETITPRGKHASPQGGTVDHIVHNVQVYYSFFRSVCVCPSRHTCNARTHAFTLPHTLPPTHKRTRRAHVHPMSVACRYCCWMAGREPCCCAVVPCPPSTISRQGPRRRRKTESSRGVAHPYVRPSASPASQPVSQSPSRATHTYIHTCTLPQ